MTPPPPPWIRMPCTIYLQAVVRGKLLCSTCVPHLGADHPRGTAKLCLGEPKSAHGEGSGLQIILCDLRLFPRHPIRCDLKGKRGNRTNSK